MKSTADLAEVAADIRENPRHVWACTFIQSKKRGIIHPKIFMHQDTANEIAETYGSTKFISSSDKNFVFFTPTDESSKGTSLLPVENHPEVIRLIHSNNSADDSIWKRVNFFRLKKSEFNFYALALSVDLRRIMEDSPSWAELTLTQRVEVLEREVRNLARSRRG